MSVGAARAIEFATPREVDVVDIDPPAPDRGEVLVETTVSAVSAGTELLAYRGELDPETAADEELDALAGDLSYPLRYGYSVVGTVTSVGDGVDPEWRGRTVFGFNPHEGRFRATPEELYPVPDGLDPETAALFANTETAVNFALDGAPRIGERVAVFGQGVVGLLTTALLSRSAAETVVAVEPRPHRRRLADALGADHTVDPDAGDAAEAIGDLTGGVDLAVEVSGRPETLETAVGATRFGGRVLAGSWYGTKRAEIGFGDHFHRGRVTVESSQVSTIAPELRGRWDRERRRETAWRELRRLAAEDDIADRLVTDRVDVEEAPAAYRRLADDAEATVQVLFTY
ncbi:zinc-dependent alcohol dehydrogenase [Halorubrum kocurii]|uniref:Oxidoreductase (Zn-dependent dehydrogenase, threonine 3-dehydrogenase) n=1 Tax=Halorubrum kocurii JCM 14978 TaxID=1230456 RepID=M0NN51_9EURY|nr:zinc-binding alcohol dehydrogenase [Halorubrum kocurii]EMA59377.1 oxidoreductase (Zn-dependent dehydrogenase, threonine 3-dehydrogenase) [Halorubrum kocurii JCM 14978]